ncbi:MAG TPA: DUF2505 family protein [Polyangiales bacterium]|nr:DUF2505 family protein [Polyangiales bacterium]
MSYPRFAKAYDSEPFNAQVMRANKLRERTLIEAEQLPDGRQRKRVRIVPELQLPAVLRQIVGERLVWYDEVTIYDDAARSAELVIESPAGERVRASGVARCHERDDDVVLRFEGEIAVHVPGLGAWIERWVVNEVTKRYREVGELLQRYVDSTRDDRSSSDAER